MDSDAANKALDADAALQELGSTSSAKPMSPRPLRFGTMIAGVADERLRLVEKTIQGRDFTCMRETVNAIEAWLGSLPGHVYANVRQPPISTLNLAHMMPFSAVWSGPERDEHFDGAAAVLRTHGRFDPLPLLAPCRRCRPRADRWPDRRGQERALGADGAAVPPLRRSADLRLRLWRLDPRRSAGDGRRLARPRRRAGRRHLRARRPAAVCPDRRAGERAWAAEWIAALLARERSPSPRSSRSISGRR